jgi:hypothetical protein
MTSSPLALTLSFKTLYFFHIFTWILTRIPQNSLIQPLEALSFICLLVRQRTILDKIIGRIPYTSIHVELPKEEKESSPEQEEKVLIAKSQPL